MSKIIRSTEWELCSSGLMWYKRWFVLDAFPNTKLPHLATARVVGPDEVYGGIWDERSMKHGADARQELDNAIEYGGSGSNNCVRFKQFDCLPVSVITD